MNRSRWLLHHRTCLARPPTTERAIDARVQIGRFAGTACIIHMSRCDVYDMTHYTLSPANYRGRIRSVAYSVPED